MGILKNLFSAKKPKETPVEPAAPRTLQKEFFRVVGLPYYKENLNKLACKNPDWSLKFADLSASGKLDHEIYRYNYIYKPVKLVPEPNNKYDKNAIMVLIAGELIGYISESDNVHVLDIINNHNVKYVSAYIHGGEFKLVHPDKSVVKSQEDMSVKLQIAYV